MRRHTSPTCQRRHLDGAHYLKIACTSGEHFDAVPKPPAATRRKRP